MKKTIYLALTAFLAISIIACPVEAANLLTFDDPGLGHGDKFDGSFYSGVTIDVFSFADGIVDGMLFDTNKTGTLDPDLEDPWAGGTGVGKDFGNILTIPEFTADVDGDGTYDTVSDSPKGGVISFTFDTPANSFSFDSIDSDTSAGYSLVFFLGGTTIGSIGFDSFADPLSPFFTPGTQFCDGCANEFGPLQSPDVVFDTVWIVLGESGGVDNIAWTAPVIPEPMSLFLLGSGLAGLAVRRRQIA